MIAGGTFWYVGEELREEHQVEEYHSDENRLSRALSTIAEFEKCGGEVLSTAAEEIDNQPDYCKSLWCGTPLIQAYQLAGELTGMSHDELRDLAMASGSSVSTQN